MEPDPKSVITCDLEGRIETFSDGAQAMFGWDREEVVGKHRVSLFSPGLVVLGHVGGWLAAAVRDGEHRTRTAFLRKDGSLFAAEIRITPTFRTVDGEKRQIGYCGVTVPLPDVPAEEAMPPIGLGTRIFRWLVVTRAPFLTASLVPVLIGAAWVAAVGAPGTPFPWGLFALTLTGALALHVCANTFNDYFDWRSGTDQENADYFMPFSGGSRSIELGLITEGQLFALATGALVVASAAGVALAVARGPGLLLFGVAGVFAAVFYTAPPLRLAARKGLGELFVGLCFGPLMVAGTAYALSGTVSVATFLLGVPAGLLTTAILWINEFPDAPADERAGKTHLVVVLGKERARWGYVALLVGALAATAAGAAAGTLPVGALLAVRAAPLAVKAVRVLFRHWDDRELVAANVATIKLHLFAGLLMAAGVRWGGLLLG